MTLDIPVPLLLSWAGLVGLIVGSYLNVVIYRLPLGLSTVRPGSRCPNCQQPIRPWHNLPVVGWILLAGRCRDCSQGISLRYPLVEASTLALFVACAYRWEATPTTLIACFFVALLLVLALIDLDHFILPDRLTLGGLVVGLLVRPFWSRSGSLDAWLAGWFNEQVGNSSGHLLGSWFVALVGAVAGGGIILLISFTWKLLRGREGFGRGDIKMLAMIGVFLGPIGVAVTLMLATLAGSIVGIGLIVARRLELQGMLPFGTFLSAGAVVALFFEEPLVRAYLDTLG